MCYRETLVFGLLFKIETGALGKTSNMSLHGVQLSETGRFHPDSFIQLTLLLQQWELQ